MNKENYSKIKKALPQGRHAAQEAADREKLLNVLEKDRITASLDLKPIEFLFQMLDKPCFPRGELVAVTGKAKSGKTFFTSMIMAACTADSICGITRLHDLPPLKCLWYDTEQCRQSTLEILKDRIMPLAEGRFAEELYDVFNMRSCDWEERMALLEVAVDQYRPDLVVVDNICDLILDINDGPGNKVFMERMMRLAQTFKCCCVIVIHQNKGSEDRNPRGSIGTEVLNKSFEVFSCELILPQLIFSVEQTHSRKHRMGGQFYFVVGDDGLPKPSVGPRTSAETAGQGDDDRKYPLMNEKYAYWDNDEMVVDLRSLFYDVLKTGYRYYTDLQTTSMELLNCKNTGYWNNLFNQAKNQGIIINTRNQEGKSVWTLPPKPAVTEPDCFEQAAAAGDGDPF